MAITVLRKSSPRPCPGGQEGTFEQRFTCQFTDTDLTGTVPSGLRKVIWMEGFTFLNESASEEEIYHSGSVNPDGSIVLSAGDLINLTRVSMAPTSGLKFCFSIEGYV